MDVILLVREYLADNYESGGDFPKAADILIGADFDSQISILDNYMKVDKCVRIADLCLEVGDVVKAEPYINKASDFLQSIDDPTLRLKFKLCNAEYLDLKLQLLEAAREYHELSKITQQQIGTVEIKEDEMNQALNSAVTCALLSGACSDRSHVLTILSQDERCPKLMIYPVLRKVMLGEFLNKQDVASVDEELKPHHRTPLAENHTLLEQMVTEHNILCTYNENSLSSSLFNNILSMDPHKVTNSAAIMSASDVRNALSSVKNEISNAQHILQLEYDAYDAYQFPQPERRQHLDLAQAHERAERGYSELSGTVESIVNEVKCELDVAVGSLGLELGGIDLTCSSVEF